MEITSEDLNAMEITAEKLECLQELLSKWNGLIDAIDGDHVAFVERIAPKNIWQAIDGSHQKNWFATGYSQAVLDLLLAWEGKAIEDLEAEIASETRDEGKTMNNYESNFVPSNGNFFKVIDHPELGRVIAFKYIESQVGLMVNILYESSTGLARFEVVCKDPDDQSKCLSEIDASYISFLLKKRIWASDTRGIRDMMALENN